MKVPIYKWSGQYWGFIYNDKLFDRNSSYKGWVDKDKRVWDSNGHYFGDIVDENYILRRQSMVEPVPRVPKVPPVSPVPLLPRVDRVGRVPRVRMIDPLK